jgi:hypothetical protein
MDLNISYVMWIEFTNQTILNAQACLFLLITGIFGDTYVYKKINKYYICSPCFLILTNLFTLTGSCCVLRGGAADTNVI